ncbi:redoxin domain-containing protein [bacterium]|nr:redoxin domain-containing protein [bacterium]MBU1025696.1 redoxin domain-containing protein [bacterium]
MKQLGKLQNINSEIESLGYQIIAISRDPVEKIQETIDKHELSFTLLSDEDLSSARALGLAFVMNEQATSMQKSIHPEIDEINPGPEFELPVPTIMFVNTNGVIEFIHSDPNFMRRPEPDIILAYAKSRQDLR